MTYSWGMSHIHKTCHLWMSHVTYECVMSRMKKACHIWKRHVTFNEACRTWRWLNVDARFSSAWLCDIWMRHVTYVWGMSPMHESCHVWMSNVTYERGMSHLMRHVAHEGSSTWVCVSQTLSRTIYKLSHELCLLYLSSLINELQYERSSTWVLDFHPRVYVTYDWKSTTKETYILQRDL